MSQLSHRARLTIFLTSHWRLKDSHVGGTKMNKVSLSTGNPKRGRARRNPLLSLPKSSSFLHPSLAHTAPPRDQKSLHVNPKMITFLLLSNSHALLLMDSLAHSVKTTEIVPNVCTLFITVSYTFLPSQLSFSKPCLARVNAPSDPCSILGLGFGLRPSRQSCSP